jgi:hypothetical protein
VTARDVNSIDAFERGQSIAATTSSILGGRDAADLDFESRAARVDHLIYHRTMDFEARARQITGGL